MAFRCRLNSMVPYKSSNNASTLTSLHGVWSKCSGWFVAFGCINFRVKFFLKTTKCISTAGSHEVWIALVGPFDFRKHGHGAMWKRVSTSQTRTRCGLRLRAHVFFQIFVGSRVSEVSRCTSTALARTIPTMLRRYHRCNAKTALSSNFLSGTRMVWQCRRYPRITHVHNTKK